MKINALLTGSDYLFAFVNRMTEEEGKYSIGVIGDVELQSINIFCEQVGSPIPHTLAQRLRYDSLQNEKRKKQFTKILILLFSPMILYFIIASFLGLFGDKSIFRTEVW